MVSVHAGTAATQPAFRQPLRTKGREGSAPQRALLSWGARGLGGVRGRRAAPVVGFRWNLAAMSELDMGEEIGEKSGRLFEGTKDM